MNKEKVKEIIVSIQNHLEKYEERFKNGAVDSTVYYLYCDDARTLLDYITNLQKENKILKENAIHNDKVVDKVNWENRLLKDKIDKLEKNIQKEIDRTNKLIEEDIGLFEINNIRKALNETRQYMLLRLRQLRGESIKEIPQFEGTLDQLDKLSIRGEDNE